MNHWEIVGVFYLYGAMALLLFGLLIYAIDGPWGERRNSARMIVTSPIWPVVFIIVTIRYFRQILKDAELPIWKHRR